MTSEDTLMDEHDTGGFTRFTITVERITRRKGDAHRVTIDANLADLDGEYATVEAESLQTALRMAVPYMEAAAHPDRLFAELLRSVGT